MPRAPHTIATSSRASTCHFGCIASRIVLHVSRFEVVCFPAKKNVLHSSTMSSTFTEAPIISSSKSFAPFLISFSHAFSFRRSINFTNDLFIFLSNFQEFKFLLVGKNLEPGMNTFWKASAASSICWACNRKTAFPSS
ncbi:hypothetical protein V8G54_006860 [Vigna mungo]|uniref:Uncharacterized protein n=1 Tax=Vigna mungo TaxID=3915 RepID=A0AAQ3P488_VIGMU